MSAASSSRTIGTLLAAAVAFFAIGCGDDALAPFQVAGTYVLQSVNGVALPAPAGYPGPADGPITVIADTLRLTADGHGSIVRVEDYPATDGTAERVVHENEFSFQTIGHILVITYDCPPNALALCVPGPHMTAEPSGSGLVVTRLLGEIRPRLVYAQVQSLD